MLARYGFSSAFHGDSLPWVTVAINIVGSLALGYLVAARWVTPGVQSALGVGFLGGFTTFSTFTVQAILDVDAGEPLRALIYVAVSLTGGLAAAAAGYAIARTVGH